MFEELLQKLLVALSLGILIGIEREASQKREELFAGVRTFTLISLIGFFSAYLSSSEQMVLPLSFLSCLAFAITGYLTKVKITGKIGLTTSVAFVLTFLMGVSVFYDTYPFLITVSIGLITAFLLVSKEYTRKFAQRILAKEVRAVVILGVLSFVILPILPDQPIDPFQAINPRTVWISLVIVLSLTFLVYAAMKSFDEKRGVVLTGILGGLISSTAVSFALSSRARKNRKLEDIARVSICLASSTMFLRMVVLTFFFNPPLAFLTIFPFLTLAIAGFLTTDKKVRVKKKEIHLESPLDFKTAASFTALLILTLIISNVVMREIGTEYLYFVSFLTGLLQVDAITITLSILPLSTSFAFQNLLIAAMSNTISKWMITYFMGTRRLASSVSKFFTTLLILSAIFLFLPKLLI